MEGGPAKILRRDDACACDGGRIPGLSVYKNLLANTIGLVFDGNQEGGVGSQQRLKIKGTGTGIDGSPANVDF